MNEEDQVIVAWLRGKERLPQPDFHSPGLRALIRRLQAGDALGGPVSVELAKALEPIGLSPMKLVLKLEHRGRGRPRNDVRRAYEKVKLGAQIDAEIAAQETAGGRKPKRDRVTAEVAERVGKGRSTGHAARAAARRAKSLDE
jgi:hypothetical protein